MTRPSFRPTCVPLEDRTTPSTPVIPQIPPLATGAASGQPPEVRVYDFAGREVTRFLAYDAGFTGGVNVAVGDVTGDQVADIVTAPKAGGGSNVRVFDGKTFALVRSFFAFDPAFTRGVSVAVANVTADAPDSVGGDIVVGAGAGGGPRVAVFHGKTGELAKSFFAFDPAFTGGVNVAATNGFWNFPPTILGFFGPTPPPPPPPTWISGTFVVGAGPGGAPHVKQLDADTLAVRESFYAYDLGFRGGVNVAALSSGVLTGAGPGGGPHVKFFGYDPTTKGPVQLTERAAMFTGAATDTNGVVVASRSGNTAVTLTPQADGEAEVKQFLIRIVNADGVLLPSPLFEALDPVIDDTSALKVGSLGTPVIVTPTL